MIPNLAFVGRESVLGRLAVLEAGSEGRPRIFSRFPPLGRARLSLLFLKCSRRRGNEGAIEFVKVEGGEWGNVSSALET